MFDFDDLPKDFALEPVDVDENSPGFVQIDDVGATVHNKQVDRAPIAVVLCPGNPGIDGLVPTGDYHAQTTGMLHIREELRKADIPCISFDWPGIGMSAQGGPTTDVKRWRAPTSGDEEPFFKSVRSVVQWAKENLSDNIVALGWNIGGYYAGLTSIANENLIKGFVSVSLAYNVYLQYLMTDFQPMIEAGNRVKAEYDRIVTSIECPTLYIIGNKDLSMTPAHKVQALIKARADKGANTTVHLIDQKEATGLSKDDYFQMKGFEKDVGIACANWVTELLASRAPDRLTGA